MGIVDEVGSGVTLLKKGDRVVMPFNVADGRCRNCEEGKTAFCTGVNPGFAGGAYGYVAMGPYRGKERQTCEEPARYLTITLRRTSSVYSYPIRRLQCPQAASWQGARVGLYLVGRYLPHGMARRVSQRVQARRDHWNLGRWPCWVDGGVLSNLERREPGLRRGSGS
jgi:hypothetical protein